MYVSSRRWWPACRDNTVGWVLTLNLHCGSWFYFWLHDFSSDYIFWKNQEPQCKIRVITLPPVLSGHAGHQRDEPHIHGSPLARQLKKNIILVVYHYEGGALYSKNTPNCYDTICVPQLSGSHYGWVYWILCYFPGEKNLLFWVTSAVKGKLFFYGA